MPKSPYQIELDKIISRLSLEKSIKKPTLLLHACCGPCSSYVIEYLSDFFDITIFYYNPNIYPEEEYNRRLEELKNLLPRFEIALKNNVKLVVSHYNQDEFYNSIGIKGNPDLAHEEEKGERCRRCYYFRMKKSYEYACLNKMDWFSTTLSISPFKDAIKINQIGNELQLPGQTKWLPSDFKKKGGFKRSLELSEQYGLYRQQYCGCIYSKTNTEKFRNEHNSQNLIAEK